MNKPPLRRLLPGGQVLGPDHVEQTQRVVTPLWQYANSPA